MMYTGHIRGEEVTNFQVFRYYTINILMDLVRIRLTNLQIN